jgi:hypothetical protein
LRCNVAFFFGTLMQNGAFFAEHRLAARVMSRQHSHAAGASRPRNQAPGNIKRATSLVSRRPRHNEIFFIIIINTYILSMLTAVLAAAPRRGAKSRGRPARCA